MLKLFGGGQCSVLWSLLGPLQIKRRSVRFSGVHACAMYSSLVAPHGSTFLSEKLMRKYIALALMLLTVAAGSSLIASPALACYGY